MKALMFDEKDAKELYPSATPLEKRGLENTFGKEFFSQKITERVKTFQDACDILGIDSNCVWIDGEDNDEVAYKKLKVIARALNEGWEPRYNDPNQRKWYPWFYMDSPGFRLSDVDCTYSFTAVGARLVFKTEELARYAAEQFSGLYSAFYEL